VEAALTAVERRTVPGFAGTDALLGEQNSGLRSRRFCIGKTTKLPGRTVFEIARGCGNTTLLQ
jgi:hypothetical protein